MNCLVPKFRKVVHISNDTILIMDYRIWKYLVNNNSDYGLAPNRPQAITCANDELVSTELWIKIRNFSVTLMHLKMSFAQWRPYYPGFNVLKASRQLPLMRLADAMMNTTMGTIIYKLQPAATSDMVIFLWCALEMIHVVRERLDAFYVKPTLPSETCSKSWKLQHVQQSFKSLFQQVSIMIKQFRLKIN